ncbi:hypothetical protein BJV82DRAFT_667420 [Fennellomyces sp. T-0311]|nr:hypothetical protein BJV82DRAFT_667420 [Fennellomyces sp. T-0311]
MTASERIYVVGGTGNVGTVVVKELLKKQVPVTLYARSPVKAQSLFGNDANLTIVEGDVNDLKPFEKSISGHTRLFLLVNDFGNYVNLYVGIAEKAYTAGVKQIVQISSISVHFPWRASFIGDLNRDSEKGIIAIPNRGAFVSLRPYRFASNITWLEFQGIKEYNVIMDVVKPEEPQEWISPNDIGAAAANILQDPIEKHGDAAYEVVGDIVSPKDRAVLLSKALGRTISYKQVTPQEQYEIFTTQAGLPHPLAYHLLYQPQLTDRATPGLSVLLGGRAPETLEQWIEANKAPLL